MYLEKQYHLGLLLKRIVAIISVAKYAEFSKYKYEYTIAQELTGVAAAYAPADDSFSLTRWQNFVT